MNDSHTILCLGDGQTPELHKSRFIEAAGQTGRRAEALFNVCDTQTKVTCYHGDMKNIELHLSVKARLDDEPYEINNKDIIRIGRQIISALEKKGYKIESSKNLQYDSAGIMTSALLPFSAPEGKTAEQLYDDLIEAHVAAHQFMERFNTLVSQAERQASSIARN